jgi:hypothetical protein
MELLERLKAGRDAIARVTVNGVEIGLRILNEQDYQLAHMAADALLLKHGTEFSLSTADAFEAEKAIQLIALSAVDPETGKRLFANAELARQTLLREDKDIISEKYLEHERSFSPSGRNLTEAEFEVLIEEVKKNPATPRLSALSTDSLRRLITSLASQLSSSPTDSGSTS